MGELVHMVLVRLMFIVKRNIISMLFLVDHKYFVFLYVLYIYRERNNYTYTLYITTNIYGKGIIIEDLA